MLFCQTGILKYIAKGDQEPDISVVEKQSLLFNDWYAGQQQQRHHKQQQQQQQQHHGNKQIIVTDLHHHQQQPQHHLPQIHHQQKDEDDRLICVPKLVNSSSSSNAIININNNNNNNDHLEQSFISSSSAFTKMDNGFDRKFEKTSDYRSPNYSIPPPSDDYQRHMRRWFSEDSSRPIEPAYSMLDNNNRASACYRTPTKPEIVVDWFARVDKANEVNPETEDDRRSVRSRSSESVEVDSFVDDQEKREVTEVEKNLDLENSGNSSIKDSKYEKSKKFSLKEKSYFGVDQMNEGSFQNILQRRSADLHGTDEATDLTVYGRDESIVLPSDDNRFRHTPEVNCAKAELDLARKAANHTRKSHSECASPFSPGAEHGFFMQHSCTPPQIRHFRQQQRHVMQLQAAMSQALNLHCLQHPSIFHHPFDSARMLAAAAARGPYKDPNRMSPTDSGVSDGDRRKRSRVFIDPLTEIPRLERWFNEDTHPSAFMIEQFTEELNRSPYRQRFPSLEPKNVQLWFKNHRAKVKRQKLEANCGSESSRVTMDQVSY